MGKTPEGLLAYQRKWRAANRDKVSAINLRKAAKRRARKLAAGLILQERSALGKFKEGAIRTPEYQSWSHARGRCTNPRNASFKNYGARGIEFRFTSFEQFIGELGPRPIGCSLDRINNNGHYEPGNVRWATAVEQRRNQRSLQCIGQM